MSDKFNLLRFENAQSGIYQNVIRELKEGKKQTHWIWFIFPQLNGLGKSQMSDFYGISGIDEARAYLSHPVLGSRYNECLKILLNSSISNPLTIFGLTDSLKLQSSLTLFVYTDTQNLYVNQVLEKFYNGIRDFTTEKMLGMH